MRIFLTIVFSTILFSCSDAIVEPGVISPETSWTTNFENGRGRLRPVDNYSRTFTLQASIYRTACFPNEKRQVYVCDAWTEIRAVSDGLIKGVFPSLGKTVIVIGHGDYHTVYINLDKALVTKGDKVGRGTKIGIIAADNIETEFWFEIYKNRDKLTPTDWILNAP